MRFGRSAGYDDGYGRRNAMVELGILTVMMVALVASLLMLRKRPSLDKAALKRDAARGTEGER